MIKAFCIKCGYYKDSEPDRCEHPSNKINQKEPDNYLREGKLHATYVNSPSEINNLNQCSNYVDVTRELPNG